MLGIFLEIAVFHYCSVLSITQWLNLSSYKPLVLPVGAITLTLSVIIADNLSELLEAINTLIPFFLKLWDRNTTASVNCGPFQV